MVLVSIHILVYTALFFIIGMIKPKWALFFLKEPSRFLIFSISLVAFMIAITVYGEGHRQETLLAKKAVESAAPISELPEAKENVKTQEVKEK